MPDIYYSTDEEIFNTEDMREAADSVFDYVDVKVGDIRVIHSGEAVKFSASSFVREMTEDMGERAYDEVGEHAIDWPDCNKKQQDELESTVNQAVDSWANKYNLHPRFWGIKNIKEIKLKFVGGDDDFYEVIS